MRIYWKEFAAFASAAFILTSCAPEKKETPPAPPAPAAPVPVAPPALPPAPPVEKPKEVPLTPQEKEKLIIEEEELEPFPG
jgi:hypothetical protein